MRNQQIITVGLLLIGALVAVYQATRPDVGLLKFKLRGDTAYGAGYTDDRSVAMVNRFLDDNPQVDTLVFTKMLGTKDSDMNMRIARRIRKDGLDTHLGRNSVIASGGVHLFAAGNRRTMECGALIGVHSWSAGPHYYPAKIGADPEQKKYEKFYADMGIDPEFYAFSRDAALPDEMYYLTYEEIERFGLLTEPANCD